MHKEKKLLASIVLQYKVGNLIFEKQENNVSSMDVMDIIEEGLYIGEIKAIKVEGNIPGGNDKYSLTEYPKGLEEVLKKWDNLLEAVRLSIWQQEYSVEYIKG